MKLFSNKFGYIDYILYICSMTTKDPFNKLISLSQEDAKVLALHGLATQNLSLKKYIETLLKEKAKNIKKHEQ